MRYNIICFPGSNCDDDALHIAASRGHSAEFVWHKDTELKSPDIIIIPGGFSYGDYLRTGAIAKFSPIMPAVVEFAKQGGLILGICNGFQILTEIDLLPGALMMNKHLKFICQHQYISCINKATPYTNKLATNEVLDIPIAHKEGNYYIDKSGLNELIKNNQIVFKYTDAAGNITDDSNPNGSIENIAGICNKAGNVLGMMPHPERAAEDIVTSTCGKKIFASIEEYFNNL